MTSTVKTCVGLALACFALTALPAARAAADPVVYAAGDVACDPTDPAFNGGEGTATACRQKHTADLMVDGTFDSVIALGDLQYNSASLSNFQQSYDLSWGRVKPLTRPVIGNHEGTSATSGAGYCSYFGAAAHCNASNRQGGAAFYSFDIGSWHVVVLNSNCDAAGGCDVGSPQYQWLADDLAANPRACTLAAWHHPRWSTGHDGSNAFMQPIWKLFYDNGGDLVLAGHSHDYERFAPIDGDGAVNAADGIRSFVVGTGGAFFTGLGSTPAPGSEVRQNDTYGILKLTLHAASYDWRFLSEGGKLFTDSGTQACRTAAGADTQAPSDPSGLSATAASSTRVDLSWTGSTDDVGVTGYEIWRGPQGGTLSRIATTSGTATTYADTTAAAGQSYDYQVRARDAGGNVSGPSNTAPATTPPAETGSTLTFRAVADASVQEASPTSNFGNTTTLVSDFGAGAAAESYLRFTVAGLGGASVVGAKLRLFVPSNAAADGPAVFGCTDPACATWTESGITWNTRPPRAQTPVADVGATAAGTWVEWDVTPLIGGEGTYALVVGQTGTTDGTTFSSDEAATNRPELVVTAGSSGGGGGGGDTQAPSAPSGLSATAASSSRVDLSWTGSTDDVGVTGYEVWRGPQGGTLARIATTSGAATTFADATVSASAGYDYQVRARDAAGNVSGPSNTSTVSTPATGGGGGATTLGPFRADADAAVKQASATTNFGTSSSLNSDSGTGAAQESYLRFTVSGVAGRSVTSAKLRLFVNSDGASDGPAVFGCSALACSTWTESGITWNNRPARNVTAVADVGAITAPMWVEWDVTSLVAGDGAVTIVVGPTPTTDGVAFRSDEATSNRPELVVTVDGSGGGGGTADTQAPSAPSGLSAAAASSSRVDLSWTGSTDDVGVTGYEVWRGPQGGTLARIATTSGTATTFADSTVSASAGYDYQVRARDAAGNVSGPSNTASVSTPAAGGGGASTLGPFRADADAAVKQASATANFGTSTSLNSDSGTNAAQESYLRFTVSGVAGRSVTSAKLRLFVNSDGATDGPAVFGCSALACSTWTETGITWNNRPTRNVTPVADVGAITAPTWVEWDVSSLVSGDGAVTIVVGPTPTTDGVVFRSDEATSNQPQLVVTVG